MRENENSMKRLNPTSVWHTSSHRCNGEAGCIAVAYQTDRVLIRSTRKVGGPILDVSRGKWAAFISALKNSCWPDHPTRSVCSHHNSP
ncbi:MAG: DUF397 domain-containing protein [Micromonosporaceae bacterium]|nr:DUF397 domain-containing protein [Micromonosporaceae bacterium]